MSIMTKRERERAFAVACRVIHEWDPYGLLKGGAPADEFDREIAAVVAQFDRIKGSCASRSGRQEMQ